MAKIIRETAIDVVIGKIECLKLVVQTAMTKVGRVTPLTNSRVTERFK
jgi:hypothetical protein